MGAVATGLAQEAIVRTRLLAWLRAQMGNTFPICHRPHQQRPRVWRSIGDGAFIRHLRDDERRSADPPQVDFWARRARERGWRVTRDDIRRLNRW